ncbi:glycosyltransferase family 39 protein [Arenibacter sp. GZD96]|uniref:ArnT family glycosyltransferase n=1 Tax=Aurantibrevibacter litoralis TaxID=3106030 RepID=UPI002AFF1F39|nr:glycosyltransferase family 39 protein [Arenibacter sp. GZD-96]MEA1787233.1 glycosyltransferase family 39 protein [Arenibacter sp. GZD-96]
MLTKIAHYLTPNYANLSLWRVFWILFWVTLFIRFPFFFRDYIDRDESTFILMGQSWVDGYLPYTQLWDLKPPIVFLFFAIIISIFGKSFIAIRFFGCLLVVISALFTFKIAATISTKKVAFWAALGCALLQSMFGSVQGVMSEHISMAFFMPALYLILKKNSVFWVFTAGVLMGLAVMTKLNLAYAVLLVGLFILYVAFTKNYISKGLGLATAYAFGILLVIFCTFLPYYDKGISLVWWHSVVRASLEYADTTWASTLKMTPFFLFIALFFLWVWKKKYINLKNIHQQILMIAFLGILFSFVKAGHINGHYLIQLYPILIIFFALSVSSIPFPATWNYKPYVLLLVLLPVEAYNEYYTITENKEEEGSYYNGEGFEVPEYIAKNNLSANNILFLDFHIGYWVMGRKPPTLSSTHPSNLCRDELFPFYQNPRTSSLEEIQFVLRELKPELIVTRKNRRLFEKHYTAENTYMANYLATEYDTIQTIDNALIYKRLKK